MCEKLGMPPPTAGKGEAGSDSGDDGSEDGSDDGSGSGEDGKENTEPADGGDGGDGQGKTAAVVDGEVGEGAGASEEDNGDKLEYELFSVLIHSGGASGGHYYAYIKSFANGKWYDFNDSSVSEISGLWVGGFFLLFMCLSFCLLSFCCCL